MKREPSLTNRLEDSVPALARAVAYAAALLVVGPLVYHIAHGSKAYLGLFEDDFYYYSIIADNFVRLGKLTYDTSTITNGFHPLWFLVLLLLRLATGALNNPFFLGLSLIFLGSMIASYELSRTFARTLGASPAVASTIALIPTVATDRVVSSGMETALDVPLLLWFLIECARPVSVTPMRAARLGVIASLAVLARLDIGLAVVLLAVGWLIMARPAASTAVRITLAFSAAGSAVPAYMACNWFVVGSLLPTSALAKQFVRRLGVNFGYLRGVAFWTVYGPAAGILLVLGVVAAIVLFRRRTLERSPAFFAAVLALTFAAIFFGLNSLSGWIYFGWYAYPLTPALIAAMMLIERALALHVEERPRRSATALVMVLAPALTCFNGISYFLSYGPSWSVEDNGLLGMSVQLAERMRDRHGTMAMGAISGFAAFVLGRPMLQLEGLVSDKAMLEHIRREDDLVQVLHDYHVDYLIVSVRDVRLTRHADCYVVTQPDLEWSGPRTAKMHGEICSPPIVHFVNRTPNHAWSIFDNLETFVFDVRAPSP